MNIKENYIIRNKEKYSKAKVMMNYHFLLQASCHMASMKDLDARCYYLTVHQRWNLREDIGRLVFLKLNQLITGKSSQRGRHRIGIIWEEDRVGTRYGRSAGYGKHYHAIVVLPPDSRMSRYHSNDISGMIKEQVSEIREAGDVHCTQYSMDQPLSEVLDYNSKYSRQDQYDGSKPNVASSVYPYDPDLMRFRDKGTDHLCGPRRQFDRSLECFYEDAAHFFTEEYFHSFGEEICEFCRENPLAYSTQGPRRSAA